MKILVTGGSGYIGKVMTRAMLEENHDVRVMDKMLYGNHTPATQATPELVIGDVNNDSELGKAISDRDAVVHLAAIVGDQACDLDKERAIHTNYLATRKLAHLCAKTGQRLLFFSTCSVYGAKPGSLITEDDGVLPLSIYAITKLAAEEAIASSGADHLILRLGTVYGYSPRMRFDLVINRMVAQATMTGSITVFGGDQYRPFVHIEDVVANSLRALGSGKHGTYNLGGNNWKILDVGERIRKATGCSMRVFEEIRDRRNYAVNSSRAIKAWGAKFTRDIDSGIDEIKAWLEGGTNVSYEDPEYNNAEWLRKVAQ